MFGSVRALTHVMNNTTESSVDEKEWRKLCTLVSDEKDPEKLSQLVEQLLKELDGRRQTLREGDR
jgi:hypothetical protein